mgnify:CR=1 FL=1
MIITCWKYYYWTPKDTFEYRNNDSIKENKEDVEKNYKRLIRKLLYLGADINTDGGELFLLAILHQNKTCMEIFLDQPTINKKNYKFKKAIDIMIKCVDWSDCVDKLGSILFQ